MPHELSCLCLQQRERIRVWSCALACAQSFALWSRCRIWHYKRACAYVCARTHVCVCVRAWWTVSVVPQAPVQTEIKGENPIVFFDIRLGNKEAGRIEMEVGAPSSGVP